MTPFELPPKKKGTPNVQFENVRSMVIVGANGSGKSRMGAWIEQRAGTNAHRLSAQRALTIPAYVQPRAYEQAECTLLYGTYDPGQKPEQRAAGKFGNRWGDEPASRMIGDFEHVLALLFADEAKRQVPRYSLYTFRHSWCTQALERGVDAVTVAVLMGHRDTTMISRVYAHLMQRRDHLRDAVRKAAGA